MKKEEKKGERWKEKQGRRKMEGERNRQDNTQ